MISIDELSVLRQTQPAREDLVDVQTVHVDATLPIAERLQDYLAQIKNPYHFLHGDSVVNITFAPQGADLKTRLKNHFISCKQS